MVVLGGTRLLPLLLWRRGQHCRGSESGDGRVDACRAGAGADAAVL